MDLITSRNRPVMTVTSYNSNLHLQYYAILATRARHASYLARAGRSAIADHHAASAKKEADGRDALGQIAAV